MSSPLLRLITPVRPGVVVSVRDLTPPVNSPLLPYAKEQLVIENADHDTLLRRLIDAAVIYITLASRKVLFNLTREMVLDSFPDKDFIDLYTAPLVSVEAFTTFNEADVADSTFTGYTVDTPGARLLLKDSAYWPSNLRGNSAVRIAYTVGHGSNMAQMPPELVQAVMLLVGHWYQNRAAGGCDITAEMAFGVSDIIAQTRVMRL